METEANIKKVCILTSAHPPFDDRIFHKEAKTLVNAGYPVVLIAQHDNNEIVDGSRIVPLPTSKDRFDRMTRIVWKLFKLALKEKADIYHLHDPELLPVGFFLKLFIRTKVIYDVHEDVPQQYFFYFDFFSNNDFTFLSQHHLFNLFFDYKYPLDPPNLIGKVYYGSPDNNANTGLVGDAYMNFGFAGITLWGFVLVPKICN